MAQREGPRPGRFDVSRVPGGRVDVLGKPGHHTHTKTIGVDSKTQDASYQVVDGQQRLTSLYAVVKGLHVWREDYSRESIALAFNPLSERFEVPTPIIKKSVEWIPDITTVFEDPINARYNYLTQLRTDGSRAVDADVERRVEIAITRLSQLLGYEFQVVQVKDEVDREVVADIFVRINSEGVNLSSAGLHPHLALGVLGGRSQPVGDLGQELPVHSGRGNQHPQ